MKMFILLVSFLSYELHASECSKAVEVCGCRLECQYSAGQKIQATQPYRLELIRAKPSSLISSPYAKGQPHVYCNVKNPQDCVTMMR